jgi:hypothetical protein
MLALVTVGLLMLGPPAYLHALLYWIFPPLWFVRNMHTLVLSFVLAVLYFYVLGANRILGAGRAPLLAGPPAAGPIAGVLGRPRLARAAAAAGLTIGVLVAVVTLSLVRYPLTFYSLPVLACVGALGWWLRGDLGAPGLYGSVLVGWSGATALLAAWRHDRTSVLFLCVFLVLPLLGWASWSSRARREPAQRAASRPRWSARPPSVVLAQAASRSWPVGGPRLWPAPPST